MYVKFNTSREGLRASLHGEIDHHSAVIARADIDAEIDRVRPKTLLLDLSDISFCDSSGLGLVMGRLRKMNTRGGTAVVVNPSDRVEKVLRLAGMDRLMTIRKDDEK